MTKLIESLCSEFHYKRSSKIKDSAASTREVVNQFYVDTFGESYDDSSPSPYGFWCDKIRRRGTWQEVAKRGQEQV